MFRLCRSHLCDLQVAELHDESHSEGEGEAVGLSAVQSLPQQLQQHMQQPQLVSPSLRCEAAEEPAGSSDSGSGGTSGPDAGLSRGSLHELNGTEEGVGRQEHQPQHRADWAAPGRGFAGGWTPSCT